MEKDVSFNPPKYESEKRFILSDTFLRLCISIMEFSLCVDTTAPDSRRYLKNATTFCNEIFTG